MKDLHCILKVSDLAQKALLVVVLFSSTIMPVNSLDHGGMYGSRPRVGSAYLLPKILSIHAFDMNKQPSINATSAGSIHIDEKGNAKLFISNLKMPKDLKGSPIKALDKNLAAEILGPAQGPQGEDENKPYFWTFHVVALAPFEKDIYHIDVQFADNEQHWKKYRVRGYQIENPQWQTVE